MGAAASAGSPAPTGDLLWAYCVTRADKVERLPDRGVHGGGCFLVERDEIAAVAGRVPRSEFDAEHLSGNLNRLDWVTTVARDHHAVIAAVARAGTVVPLRLCTLFESARTLRGMLGRERLSLEKALDLLDGRAEWSVKVITERHALGRGPAASEPEEASAGAGRAYLMRRRRERDQRLDADRVAAEIADGIHTRLSAEALAAVEHPAQNRTLAGYEGTMLLNAAYLVERERSDHVRELVSRLDALYRPSGVRLELAGPWPPYNFVPAGGAQT